MRRKPRNPINPKRALGYRTERLESGSYWTYIAKPFHHRCYGASVLHRKLSDAERFISDTLARYWDYRGHVYRTNQDDADNYRTRETTVAIDDE